MIALLLAVLYTSTARVSGVAVSGGMLWAATSSGVEQYDLRDGVRLRVLTTEDGLDSNQVLRIRHDATGDLDVALGVLAGGCRQVRLRANAADRAGAATARPALAWRAGDRPAKRERAGDRGHRRGRPVARRSADHPRSWGKTGLIPWEE